MEIKLNKIQLMGKCVLLIFKYKQNEKDYILCDIVV